MHSKSLNVRLTAVFSLTFVVFTVVMFFSTYHLLKAALRQDEDARAHRIALRFWALYQAYGDELLSEEVFRGEFLEDRQALIRVAGEEGSTLLLYFPEHFEDFTLRRLENRTEESFLLFDRSGERALQVLSIRLPDSRLLQIGMEVTGRILTLRQFRLLFPLLAIPFLFLAVIGGLIFSRNSLRPIGSLIRTSRSIIETGRMESRIPTRGSGDELDELVELFNRMIARIDLLISGMRQSLDNVAHDLRTPITRLKGRAELALRSGDNPEEALQTCLDEAEGIRSMLSILMDISEAETGSMKLEKSLTDVSAVLEDMAELYEYAAEDKAITVETDIQAGLSTVLDQNRFRQALANLLDNAMKYTPEGGRILLSGEQAGEEIVIRVADSGIGISAEDSPHIWDRLYRGDRSRSEPGLGLGLSLVRAIAQAHGGSVSVSSTEGEGSTFMIHLPGITEM